MAISLRLISLWYEGLKQCSGAMVLLVYTNSSASVSILKLLSAQASSCGLRVLDDAVVQNLRIRSRFVK